MNYIFTLADGEVYHYDSDTAESAGKLADAIDAVLPPEIPPEVHNTRPIDADRAMAAVRAMSGGRA